MQSFDLPVFCSFNIRFADPKKIQKTYPRSPPAFYPTLTFPTSEVFSRRR